MIESKRIKDNNILLLKLKLKSNWGNISKIGISDIIFYNKEGKLINITKFIFKFGNIKTNINSYKKISDLPYIQNSNHIYLLFYSNSNIKS